MFKKYKKSAVLALAVVAGIATFSSTVSARLINQQSQGHGIKCFAVPVTQANGTVVYQNVCRKVGV